jgi:hypothetical protein
MTFTADELERLRAENAMMLEALQKLCPKITGCVNDRDFWTENQKIAFDALTQIPETDKYVRLRDAERAVIKATRRHHHCCIAHNTCPACDLLDAIKELDKVEKENEIVR